MSFPGAGQGRDGNRRTRVRIRIRPGRKPAGPGPERDPAPSDSRGVLPLGSGSDNHRLVPPGAGSEPVGWFSMHRVRIVPGEPSKRISSGPTPGKVPRKSREQVRAGGEWRGIPTRPDPARIADESETDGHRSGSGPRRVGFRARPVRRLALDQTVRGSRGRRRDPREPSVNDQERRRPGLPDGLPRADTLELPRWLPRACHFRYSHGRPRCMETSGWPRMALDCKRFASSRRAPAPARGPRLTVHKRLRGAWSRVCAWP
jgi:hypothetical protein